MASNHPLEAPSMLPRSFASFFQKPTAQSSNPMIRPVKYVEGTPRVELTDDEFDALVAPHRLCLVGKFSYGRPKMEEIQKEFRKIGFNGSFSLGLLNPRHILVRFDLEEDYQRCWMRTFWDISGFSMRILKWTPDFKFEEDPPIVPIWVSFFDLPIQYHQPGIIFSMSTAIGKPLRIDTPTLNMTRPSVARCCVEVDLTKDFPKYVEIGKKNKIHVQEIHYEFIPSYCSMCSKIGHTNSECRLNKSKDESKDVGNEIAQNGKEMVQKGKEIVQKGEVKKNSFVFKQKFKWQPRVNEVTKGAKATTSGLSEQEKSHVATDLQASGLNKVVVPENNFSSGDSIDNLVGIISPTRNKFSILMEDSQVNHLEESYDDVEEALEEKREPEILKNMEERLNIPDDSVVGLRSSADTDAEFEPDGCWSEGDKDDALVTYTDEGKIASVKRRRGRKQNKNNGMPLRRSSRLH